MAKPVSRLLAQAKSALRQGQPDKAAALYREVLSRFPGNTRAKDGLAAVLHPAPAARAVTRAEIDQVMALYEAGQFGEALTQARALARLAPGMRALLDIRAACHRALGRPERALELYRHGLETSPRDTQLWRNCGAVLLDMVVLDDAADCLGMATRLDPANTDAWVALGQCQLLRGRPRQAFDAVAQALARDDTDATALNLLGRVQRELGDLTCAGQAHERALTVSGDAKHQTAALTGLGVLAGAHGQRDQAEAYYVQALNRHPHNVQAHLNLSRLHSYTADDPHLAGLRSLAARDDLPLADRAQVHFALFNALDQIAPGSDEAFLQLDTANTLRRAHLRYRPERDTALFAYLSRLGADLPQNAQPAPAGTPRPVFIVGLPRSGTTVTERILSAAPGVHGAGELPVVDNAALALLRQLRERGQNTVTADQLSTFADTIRQGLALYASGAPVIIDKMPLNFRWTALILAALPEARVIHITRDAVETCWSNFRTCFAGHGNAFAYGLTDLARYHDHCQRHMALCHARAEGRLHRLRYEDLIQNTAPVAQSLVAFCGLNWSEGCLHPERSALPILTASAQQARKPVYNGNRRSWQRYGSHLFALLDALEKPKTSASAA